MFVRLFSSRVPATRSPFLRCALLAAAVLLVFAHAPGARAQQTDLASLGPRLEQLLSEGKTDEARALLRASVGNDVASGLHIAHFEGVILMRQKRYQEAIEVFRQILNVEPNFVPSRVELARALYATGQTDAASFHFSAINLGADDIALKRLAQGYLERIATEKPYGFNGYFGFVPSTNVNRGTQETVFLFGNLPLLISPDSREQSGIGVAGGISGYRNLALGDSGSGLSFAGAIDLKKYFLGTAYDEASFTASASFTQKWKRNAFRIGPTADYTLYGWNPALVRYGLSGGVSLGLGPRTGMTVSAAALRQDYLMADFRDGWLMSLSTGVRHMLSPSLAIGASAGVVLERTDVSPDLDHNDVWVGASIDKEWTGGLITGANLRYENHTYLDRFVPMSVLPARIDNRIAAGLRLAHRRLSWKGFAPQLTYEFTRQFSNISFYDYTSHDVGLTVTRNF
jgi:tetratricopeptide (TPR) repeat protein